MKESLRCWNRTTTIIYNRAYPRGHYFVSSKFLYSQLWVPFSNCLLSSQSSFINLTTGMSLAEINSLICPGLLTASRIKLTPSPGERFNLTVEALDEFLRNVSTLASLTVNSSQKHHAVGSSDVVLLLFRCTGTMMTPYNQKHRRLSYITPAQNMELKHNSISTLCNRSMICLWLDLLEPKAIYVSCGRHICVAFSVLFTFHSNCQLVMTDLTLHTQTHIQIGCVHSIYTVHIQLGSI